MELLLIKFNIGLLQIVGVKNGEKMAFSELKCKSQELELVEYKLYLFGQLGFS
jgi:hypothetical protein